jgi:hypothetical protein
MVSVSGLRRVPSPAANIIACFMWRNMLYLGCKGSTFFAHKKGIAPKYFLEQFFY